MKHPSEIDAQQIWPSFWLGSYSGDRILPEFVVICAFPNFAMPHPDGVFISFGMHDREGAVPPRKDLESLVASVRPWIEDHGMPSFWHCQAGLNRSAFLLAYYICSVRRLTADQAIRIIREKRTPGILGFNFGLQPLFNQSFERALREWFPE